MGATVRFFAIEGSRALGTRVSEQLGVELAAHEEREFEDGEHKTRPLVSVRDQDVYVLHSLHGRVGSSANDALVRLLLFVGAVRDAGAARITVMTPYLCYSRKDRRTKERDPISTRYVASLFEAVGASRLITVDVHNLAAFENAFRFPVANLTASDVFVDELAPSLPDDVVVLSPDVGGVKRVEAFRDALSRRLGRDVPTAFMDKQRSMGVVSGDTIVGDVRGRTVVILDDLIASGTTIRRAAHRCRDQGAARILALATHGVFVPAASDVLIDPIFDEILLTDSVQPLKLRPDAAARVRVVTIAGLLASWVRDARV